MLPLVLTAAVDDVANGNIALFSSEYGGVVIVGVVFVIQFA